MVITTGKGGSDGTAGNVTIIVGRGSAGVGSALHLAAGASDHAEGVGGDVDVASGSGPGGSGNLTLASAPAFPESGPSVPSGNVSLASGVAPGGKSGTLVLGTGSSKLTAGAVTLQPGDTLRANGADLTLAGGRTTQAGSTAGDISISGGRGDYVHGMSTNRPWNHDVLLPQGGDVAINGGDSLVVATDNPLSYSAPGYRGAPGGRVDIRGGLAAHGNGGGVSFKGGDSQSADSWNGRNGGNLELASGSGRNASGDVELYSPDAAGSMSGHIEV